MTNGINHLSQCDWYVFSLNYYAYLVLKGNFPPTDLKTPIQIHSWLALEFMSGSGYGVGSIEKVTSLLQPIRDYYVEYDIQSKYTEADK